MNMPNQTSIRDLLQSFQDGYTRRDITHLDDFMDLFSPEAEVIGTNGVRPGADEWYTDRTTARKMIQGDWESWGDLRLDLGSASIHSLGDVGWITVPATVTQTIGTENYASYLNFVKEYIDRPGISAEQKLHYILRGGTNTVYELQRGEKFVWPLRLTAVAARESGNWKFVQMNFSFPTVYFPDVRVIE
jgi:hypothetical protein